MILVGLSVLATAACGSPWSAQSARSAATVRVEQSRFGPILETGTGHTLYIYRADPPFISICFDTCVAMWPPMTVRGRPIAGPGINPKALGTAPRTGGIRQVTYYGSPLYTYAFDTRPHETGGQDVLELWNVISPSGRLVTATR